MNGQVSPSTVSSIRKSVRETVDLIAQQQRAHSFLTVGDDEPELLPENYLEHAVDQLVDEIRRLLDVEDGIGWTA